jgi:hypothetical protein
MKIGWIILPKVLEIQKGFELFVLGNMKDELYA